MAAEPSQSIPEKTTRIHVTNLPFALTNEELQEFFSKTGKVVNCSIVTKSNGDSKGFGFVEYDTLEASERCCAELNNELVQERRIGVVYSTSQGPYESDKTSTAFEDGEESARLHVRELAWSLKRQHLEEAFSVYGKVLHCRVVKNKKNGRSRGYGFLEFESVEEATAAKNALDGTELEGRAIAVLFSKSEGPRPSSRNRRRKSKTSGEEAPQENKSRGRKKRLVVKNLTEDTTADDVVKHFQSYGKCEAEIKSSSRGNAYSFLTFEQPEEAQNALDDKGSISGNQIEIIWAKISKNRGRGRREKREVEVEEQETQM